MSKKAVIATSVLLALGFTAVAAAGAWYFWLRGDAPEQVSLESALAAAATGATAPAAAGGGLAGEWSIVPGGTSFAGYRVKEELARVGATTAVGRSAAVAGSMTYDGAAITAVQVTVDLSSLKSDSTMRDGALRMQALETGKYPTASFRLTQPIPIEGTPTEGTKLAAAVSGELTLHGVTRPITVLLEGQFSGGQVVVVGMAEVAFADFGIAQPRAASVLSVDDRGTLELQLVFEKAGSRS